VPVALARQQLGRTLADPLGMLTIRDLSAPLAQLPPERLEDLDGIGQDLAGKIRTLLETGDLPLRQEFRGEVPPGLRDLITVPGLGSKRAQALHQRLRIGSLDDLRAAAEKHRIRRLRGFAAKTEERSGPPGHCLLDPARS
jgi:DNA polymerase (family 10)